MKDLFVLNRFSMQVPGQKPRVSSVAVPIVVTSSEKEKFTQSRGPFSQVVKNSRGFGGREEQRNFEAQIHRL